jgi:hypothetical protein
MITHIMFGETILVIAPYHGVSQMQVFDFGLQFARVLFGDLPAEDHRQFVASDLLAPCPGGITRAEALG